MTKKKKDKEGEPKPPAPAPSMGTSLRGLLRDVQLSTAPAKPVAPPPRKHKKEQVPASGRPSDGLRGDDRIAFMDAMVGVRPVEKTTPRVSAPAALTPEADAGVRARLGALVAGGVRFEIERFDEEVRGLRAGTSPSILRSLMTRAARPEATLDLHGMRADRAEAEIARFVRAEHRRGRRRLCIVHGKGLHSQDGRGVLAERSVHALTEGGAAPLVLAFATAHADLGGSGALLVELAEHVR